MDELGREHPGSGAWTAADIEDSSELAASGGMVVDDCFVDSGVVAWSILGVVRALRVCEGSECFFTW